MTIELLLIVLLWAIIGTILGYRREEKNITYDGGYDRGLLMIGSIILCPVILIYAIVKYVFMRPWD